MRKGNSPYKQGLNKACLLSAILLIKVIAFSQQTDSTVSLIDSVAVTNSDSTDTYDDDEETYDSVKKAKYNYYISTDEWENGPLELRQVPDSVIKYLKAQDDFWYADREFQQDKPKDAPRGNFLDWLSRQQWYKVLAWIIIIGGFIAVLIWFLANSNASLFRRRSKTIEEFTEGEATENIFEINYQKEIENATQAGNYRLATRLLFLRLLTNLSEKNIIRYKQDRTNFDYLLQLSNTGYYKDFFRLTRNYEYAWYGEFTINSEAFTIIKNDFDSFNNKLS